MADADTLPSLPVGGDPRHGVVRFARDLADGVRAVGGVERACEHPPASGAAHIHFTDRLWGATPEDASRRIRELADRLTLTVTLHDVPQASDGPRALPRRVACYREVVDGARGVVVNSVHEALLLREYGVQQPSAEDPAVIPLPVIRPLGGDRDRPLPRLEIALLGHIYPGKGHAEAILAAGELGRHGPRLAVQAFGAPSAGHAENLRELAELAARQGVEFAATGWLEEEELLRRCRRAAVPLAAHTHLSASGSIHSWIAAGRCPLVADSRYAREIEALRPGTMVRYRSAELPSALGAAIADPARTWLPDGVDTRPHLEDVARAYLAWWTER